MKMIFISLLIFSLFLGFFSSLSLPRVFAQNRVKSPAELKLKEEEIRIQMLQISKELGVTCTECHSTSNWKDSSKNAYKVGLEHMKLVDLLKQKGMDGKNKNPEANCYMCHRGQLNYKWKSN